MTILIIWLRYQMLNINRYGFYSTSTIQIDVLKLRYVMLFRRVPGELLIIWASPLCCRSRYTHLLQAAAFVEVVKSSFQWNYLDLLLIQCNGCILLVPQNRSTKTCTKYCFQRNFLCLDTLLFTLQLWVEQYKKVRNPLTT